MYLCALWVVMFGGQYDFYILDQVSFPIPLIRLRSRNVFFYCHYPDKLLSTNRGSFWMRVYRFFMDYLEELTTGMARCIVVNSMFTQKVFLDNFPLIRRYCRGHRPRVLYPAIDNKAFVKEDPKVTIQKVLGKEQLKKDTVVITSLNRYERKKNIPLALESFAYYLHHNPVTTDVMLVIAGGYDPRLPENVDVHRELENRARELGIRDKVVFLKSINNDERITILENSTILMYTPENEHFGIVPVEAMYMGCIVFACNSGGPLESVSHENTGYLMSPVAEEWGRQVGRVVGMGAEERDRMREQGRERVEKMFTNRAFAK